MRPPHSSTPAAFQSESPHQECAGQGKASQSKPRNWKKRLLLQPPELGDDSDLSSSSGSIVPYVHPTEGKTHLSIKDTEDYLTVQNPNPHTGRMSPAFSSVVTERPEPITLRGPKDANQGLQSFAGRSLDNEQRPRDRWPDFWRPLRKVSTLKRKPPAPYVEDEVEEPPDGLSDISPLQAQPCPTHFAAFDPDHLRIPGALRVSPPPPKTTTSEGTDAIATWVTTGSRRIYELPASNTGPPEMELPSVPQHEPSSRHVRFSDDCAVSYPCYQPPSPPMHQYLPSPPPEMLFTPQIPKFAKIEITRKPLSKECEEEAPPVPPKHEYIPKTWNQSTQTRASVVSSRSHTIEPVYKSDAALVEKTPTRLNGNGVPRLVITKSKKVDQEKEKEEKTDSMGKDKENEGNKGKKREKGYRREKELLPPSAHPKEKRTSLEKSKTAEVADHAPKPKSRTKTSTSTARESASTSTPADRSATLKAALDRITAAKAKRHSSAPVQAATAPATTETAKPRASAAKTVLSVSRPKSTTAKPLTSTAATTASAPPTNTTIAAVKEAEARVEADAPQTTTAPSPVFSLTITRENAVLVGKLFLGLWGLLACFYLLGALGRALWVVLAPIRFLFGGVGRLGGCVRGAGW